MGFLRYMRESIGKRLTVKHLTTVCLQSDKGQVKQLSLYSHTVFCALCSLTICVETRNKTRQIPKNLNSMLDSAGAEPA